MDRQTEGPDSTSRHDDQEMLRLDGKAASEAELELARRTIQLLEALAPSLLDDGAAAQALHDVGQLKLHPLDDVAGALESLRAAFGRRQSLHIARAYRKAALRAGSVPDQILALEAEARAATSPSYRAALETERGALVESTRNLQAARQCYATATELNPSDMTALLALLRLALHEKDVEGALSGAKRIAEASGDPRVKAEYLAWAGRLYDADGKPAEALAAAVQAEVHAKDSPSVRFLLERLYAKNDQPRELCALLEAELNDGDLPSLQGWVELGVLARYHLRDLDWAERAFQRVADKAEGATRYAALSELSDIWARKGEWPKVLAVEEELVAAETDARGLAMGWTRIGQLREEKLDDRKGAAEAYSKALAAEPSFVPALEGAGRAFAGDVEKLLWMHKTEAQHAASPVDKAAALRRAGELLLEDSARLAEGTSLLREALTAAPAHPGIFSALERALRAQNDFAGLADLYELELARDLEPGRRAALHIAVGELAHDRLNDDARAIASFRAAAAIPAGVPHHALTRLMQLLEHKGELGELESVLAQLAALTEDPARLASLYERVAQLQDSRGDLDAAIRTYRQALPSAPPTHSIVAAAGRAFARAGLWNDVLTVYERAEQEGSPAARASFGYRAGVVLARKLERIGDGIARLETVRKESPGHLPTLAALAALYQEGERWDELGRVLDELPPTPGRRLRRAATADAAKKLDEATAAYQAALDDGVAVERCRARLFALGGKWEALADAYRSTEPNGAGARATAHASYRAGEIRRDKLGQPDRAVELFSLALAADAESVPILLALYNTAEEPEARRGVLRAIVGRLRDPALRAALLGQLAAMPSLPDGEVLAARVNQLALSPFDPVIMVRIEQVLEARHNREATAALLRDMRRDGKIDAPLGAAAAARLGVIAEELGNFREAADHFESSLVGDMPSFLARLALPRLYAQLGDEARLSAALAGLADALPPGPERASVLRRLASHQHLRGEDETAARTLEAALAAHALDFAALRQLSAIAGSTTAERLIDPLMRAFSVAEPGALKHDLGLALTTRLLAANRLGPAREALDRLDDGDELRACLLRAELETRAEAWPAAAKALAHIASHEKAEATVKIEALRRLTALELDKLGNLEGARDAADKLGALDPTGLLSIELRLRIAEHAEDVKAAAALLAELVRHPDLDDERRAEQQLHLASLQEVQLDDAAAAIQTLGEIKLPSRRRAAVDRLLDLGGRTNRWDLAASALEATLDRTGRSADMDPVWELAIRSRLANLLEGPLARPESAMKQYERIVGIDRGHVPALERLAELSSASAPEKAADYHRALLESQPTRLSSYRALRKLFVQMGDEDGAFVTEALLEGVGAADEEESYFYRQRRARLKPIVDGALTAEERALLAPELESAPFALLAALSPSLPSVFPIDYAGYGVDPADAGHGSSTANAANRAARLFGVNAFRLVAVPNRVAACVEPGVPPVLLVPRNLDDATPREQACVLGELMARVAFAAIVGDPRRNGALSPQLVEQLLWAACEVAVSDAQAPQRGKPVYEDVKRRLAAAIEAQPRTELAIAAARLLAEGAPDGAAILSAMERVVTRASLFAAQDPTVALGRARAGSAGRGLESLPPTMLAALPFVVSSAHLALRKRLGLGVAQ